MVLCKLLIVNVWQKVLTCVLKAGFDAQNFRQQGQAIAENHCKELLIPIQAWKI